MVLVTWRACYCILCDQCWLASEACLLVFNFGFLGGRVCVVVAWFDRSLWVPCGSFSVWSFSALYFVLADMCGELALMLWASNFHVFAFVVLCFGLFWCIAIRILYFVCLGGHLWRVGFVSVCVFFFYVMVVVFLSLAFGLVCILSVWFDSCVLNFVVAFDVPVRRVC